LFVRSGLCTCFFAVLLTSSAWAQRDDDFRPPRRDPPPRDQPDRGPVDLPPDGVGSALGPDAPPGFGGGSGTARRGEPGGPLIAGRRRIDWEMLKKYDPELYDLERQDVEWEHKCQELSGQLRRAMPEFREAIRAELSDAVARHFDVRQQRRRLQLKRLEDELAKAREAVEKRDSARDELIAERLAELTGEADPLGF
jgi:hypothetical protein